MKKFVKEILLLFPIYIHEEIKAHRDYMTCSSPTCASYYTIFSLHRWIYFPPPAIVSVTSLRL